MLTHISIALLAEAVVFRSDHASALETRPGTSPVCATSQCGPYADQYFDSARPSFVYSQRTAAGEAYCMELFMGPKGGRQAVECYYRADSSSTDAKCSLWPPKALELAGWRPRASANDAEALSCERAKALVLPTLARLLVLSTQYMDTALRAFAVQVCDVAREAGYRCFNPNTDLPAHDDWQARYRSIVQAAAESGGAMVQVQGTRSSSLYDTANQALETRMAEEAGCPLFLTTMEAGQAHLKVLLAQAAGQDVISPLVEQLGSPQSAAAEKAAQGLANLALTDANQLSIVKTPGALPGLVHVLRHGTGAGPAEAAGALQNLSSSAENDDVLGREPGLLKALVMLERSGHAEAKELATSALRNLSFNPKLKASIARLRAS